MPIKTRPSFLVIFCPVLMRRKNDKTAMMRKIRAMTKGEKSAILMGAIKDTIPKMKVEVMATLPIKLPKIIQSWPRLAACKQKKVSGMLVPMATTKIPINPNGKLNV